MISGPARAIGVLGSRLRRKNLGASQLASVKGKCVLIIFYIGVPRLKSVQGATDSWADPGWS